MTGVAKGTVTKLLVKLGETCQEFHDAKVRNLKTRRVQCAEIWSFCGAKKRNVPVDKLDNMDYGDVWTWTAIDADSKLVPSWIVGNRDAGCAWAFIEDLKGRLANRVQLTTDGLKLYLGAVEDHFGADVDYAICVKLFGAAEEHDTKYSPARCIGVTSETI